MTAPPPHAFSVAPMMDWTDRWCRRFHRVLTGRALLYTEMVVADAVIHGDRERLLGFDAAEHPVALQLGGSDPVRLGEAARIGAAWGYDEINLNVGCPSDRVQDGCFGAVLMKTPGVVADCIAAMRAAVPSHVDVTVKCRLGVDDDEPRVRLFSFVETVAAAGCRTFIVHARKAWLSGLSPKENRNAPPLDYALVRELKRARPDLTVVLNGGLLDLAHARHESAGLDGVMLGRAAYHTPAILGDVDRLFFGGEAGPGPLEVARMMRPIIEDSLAAGAPLHHLVRPMLGLFHGRPGARRWRQLLSGKPVSGGAGIEAYDAALAAVSPEFARA